MYRDAERNIMRYYVTNLKRIVLLKLIAEQNLEYGYGIIIKLKERFGTYLSPSNVYPILGKLEKGGLVKSQWVMVDDTELSSQYRGLKGLSPYTPLKRIKKVYSLTPEGKDYLIRMLKVLDTFKKLLEEEQYGNV